ncbi:MAG: lysophospholipid acyltransferase family protein [Gammaproteobacteria bacterium]|nr:MAG: lysophospholipid acyltransferase family protein [Gammaproteobacteria bacterium]
MIVLRSLFFFLGQVIITLVHTPFMLLTLPFSFKVRYAYARLWGKAILFWLRITCGITYTVQGAEHIPTDQTAIIMCKHQSAWETISLQSVFPPQVWVLKRVLLLIPLFGWALAMLNPVSIDRKASRKAIEQIVEQGKQRLDNGIWIVIFPEGTRVAPGQRGDYHRGGAILAERTGYPVVPVAHNAGEFWPRNSFIKKPGVIEMHIGALIPPEGKSARQIIAEVKESIEGMMTEPG